ncbi:MAG TPA: fibronectin type III domain-containing protein [Armatimonadota bacterium]|nr:fibronectin type III domain-containing protein [Armatimonadota bacterium]
MARLAHDLARTPGGLRYQSQGLKPNAGGGPTSGTGPELAQQTPRDLDLTFFDFTGLSGDPNAVPKSSLLPATPYTDTEPVYGADRSTVYFASNRPYPGDPAGTPPSFHLWEMKSDGSFQVPVGVNNGSTFMGPLGTDQQWPAVSPTGTFLAYSSRDVNGADKGIAQIHIFNLNTGVDFQITSGPGDKTHPTWSRSTVLAFQDNERTPANPGGANKIWIVYPVTSAGVDPTTSPRLQLTGTGQDAANANFDDSQPAWEPSGVHIAFTRYDGTHYRIWIISHVTGGLDANGDLVLSSSASYPFTDYVSAASGIGSDDEYASWRPQGADFTGDNPDNDSLTFASTRKSSADPNLAEQGANSVGTTFGIYRVPIAYKDVVQSIPYTETAARGQGLRPAVVVAEDTQHPGYSFNDITPAWSPETKTDPITGDSVTANRIVYASNSGVPYGTQPPFTSPQGWYDLWSTEIYDLTPPALVQLPTVTPRLTAPGQPVTISVRIADLHSGVAHVYAQIKNPNSYLQDPRLPTIRNSINGINLYAGNVNNYGDAYPAPLVLDGHRIYEVESFPLPFNQPNFIGPFPIYRSYDEVGYQPINPVTYSYTDEGMENLPFDLQTSGNEGLATGILSGQPADSIELQPSTNDPTLYSATWVTDPNLDTDYLLDVIAQDNDGNAIDYDNIWGFSTKVFTAGKSPILLVADYVTPQPFILRRGGDVFGTMFGVESWLTDNPLDKIGTGPGGGGAPPLPFVGFQTPSNAVDDLNTVDFIPPMTLPKPPVEGNYLWGYTNTLGPGSWVDAMYNGLLNHGNDLSNTVAGGPDAPPPYNIDARVKQNNTVGWPAEETEFESNSFQAENFDAYDIWRVVCRGAIPPDALDAYGAVPVLETDPTDVNKSIPGKSHPRCVVWASPFTADEYVGAGTILDGNIQKELQDFVQAGGRLYLTGQDIAWALSLDDPTSNVPSHKFLRENFGVQFLKDIDGPVGGAATDNGGNPVGIANPIGDRWGPALVNPLEGPDSPLTPLPHWSDGAGFINGSYYFNNPNGVFEGAHDNGFPDTVTTVAPPASVTTVAAYNQNGDADVVSTENSDTTAKTVYSGFGIEGINDDYQTFMWDYKIPDPANNPLDYTKTITQPVDQISSFNRRALLMHGIVDWLRDNTVNGIVNVLEPDGQLRPQPNVLVTASLITSPPSAPPIASALSRADGTFTLYGIPTGGGFGGGGPQEDDGTSIGVTGAASTVNRREGGPDTVLYATAPGYTQIHNNPIVLGKAGSVAFTTYAVLVSAEPPGVITGKVTDAVTNAPIAGATVTASNTQFPSISVSGVTDKNGNYLLPNVPAIQTPPPPGLKQAAYVMTFSAKGYVTATKTKDDTSLGPIVVQSGATLVENQALQTIPPPMNLTAVAGDTTVTLNWDPVPGTGVTYNVKRSLVSGKEAVIQANVSGTSYTDTGRTNGTTYYYTVSANVGGLESPDSNEVSATPLPKPSAPTNLTAVPGDMTVTLSWTAASGADTYNIERSTSPGTETSYKTLVTGTTFTDTGLTNGTTYYYTVSGVNGAGEGPVSNEASATPLPPPSAPSGLTATLTAKDTVTLTWTGSTTAVSYNVKRGTAAGKETTIKSGVTGTSYVDTGLTEGQTYYYIVTAVNLGGEGTPSNEVSITPPLPPAAPATLTATAGKAQVTLDWPVVTNASSYTIQRSTTAGAETTIKSGVTATTYTNTGLTPGTTYYYVVFASNLDGDGPNSPEASATPPLPPAAPLNLVGAAGNGLVMLTWNASAGATSYNVKRGQAPGQETTTIAPSITATSFTDSSVTRGTTYYYVVTANGVGGESANSNEVSVTPPNPPAPAASVTATANSSTLITVAWTDTTGDATSFKLERMTAGGSFTVIATLGADVRSYQDSGLKASTTYTYKVIASNPGGDAAEPNPTASATTLTAPAAPMNLTATAVSGTQVNLIWTDTAGDATSFEVEREISGGTFAQIATVGANARSYSDTTVSPNMSYVYRVRAVNTAGPSDYSNLATVMTGTDQIKGTVTVSAGVVSSPAPGVTVQLLNGAANLTLSTTTTDNSGQYSFANLTDGTYTVQLSLPAGQPAVAPATVTVKSTVNGGVTVQDFTISPLAVFQQGITLVSIPFDYNGTGVTAAQVFGLPVAGDGSAPIAGYDAASNSYKIYPNLPISGTQTLPGRGYWIRETAATPFLNAGKPVSSPFEVALQPGWNLIGDPYLTPLDLTALQIRAAFQVGANPPNTLISLQAAMSANLVGNIVWGYSASQGQYVQATSLQPFAGYWIYVDPQVSMNQSITLRYTQPAS